MEVSCSICCEEFHSNSQISSTRCGHVFHTSCIEGWMGRNSTCPECHQTCTEAVKIYLTFENTSEKNESTLLLKNQLELSIKNANEIQNLLQLTEENILSLQEQIQVLQSELETIQEKNAYLKIQTETKGRELSMKTNEIIKLREGVKQMSALKESQLQNDDDTKKLSEELSVKNEKIKNLEEQIRQKSLQLEEEIQKTAVLIYDKTKLQNSLDSHVKNNVKNRRSNMVNDQENQVPLFLAKPSEHSQQNEKNKKIRINGFQVINSPLKDVVIYLANIMEIKCENDDIANITQNKLRNEISLTVEFISNNMRQKFILNKNKLNGNQSTKNLKIVYQDFLDNKHELLAYTKKLKDIGFKFCFIRSGCVIARKDENSPFIRIHNKQQVDDILRENAANMTVNRMADCGVLFSTI